MTTLGGLDSATTPTDDGGAVEWRRIEERVWVARSGGRHLGMVEQGRFFTVTLPTGTTGGRYRTLDEAQGALVDPARAAGRVVSRGRRMPRSVLAVTAGGLGLVVVALTAAAMAIIR